MVEEPVKTVEWHFAIHFLIDVESARDRLVVGSVEAKRPTVFDEVPNDRLEFSFHHWRHVRAWLEEVLEIRRRVDQHLPRAIDAEKVVARAGSGQPRPVLKVC